MYGVDMLVDRMHVSVSDVTVIRRLRSRMKGKAWTKAGRKAIYRHALARHHDNRNLYLLVMGGNF